MELAGKTPYRFGIPQRGQMRVPGIVYASRELIPDLAADRSLQQVANVATLPGIVTASFAMPDVHLGYGFPIGGVAATDPAVGGVVSPGGVGFDISCGVRLLAASLDRDEVRPVLGALMDQFAAAVPRGAGRGGIWHLTGASQMADVLADGARYAVKQGGAAPGGKPRPGQPLPGDAGGRRGLRRRHGTDPPQDPRETGQPVLIPGPMGTSSYVPAGIPGGGASARGLAEETPGACKDANTMVQTAQGGGLCRKIPRLVPLGVVKG